MPSNSASKINQYFRQTIPMMVKNNVPITPPYYTLWYNYTTGELPKLTQRIDDVIKRLGHCDSYMCDKLLDEFIVNSAEERLVEMQNNIHQVVTSIGTSTATAMSDAQDLNQSLSKDIQIMAQEASQADSPAAHKMVSIARNFMDKTETYRTQLEKQNAEIQALKAKIAETEKQMFKDGLTEINNRRKFNEDLAIYTASADNTCLVMVDIDHFKPFNDEYGHLLGDKVIQSVARTLETSCAQTRDAQAYRFGGEEFAILLPNADIKSAAKFANDVRERISRLNLTNKKTGQSLRPITTSLGVAQFQPGESLETLLERADQHLYAAKNAGRNCVRPVITALAS
ncbi:putative diguanylate cyclase YdaM [Marinomonas aquimarina]|uniref:diguanylate cyclase n=1 Tax=Marinomonas aquimarina TaxID=295068 RepID=A0A1A8THE2_9GAMM|nr:GGDEF domain-containing protein [Marinomonas aquimarina]SBS32665.1 putative diguanylate cyclase YdaM [Marinomonas aquimarina]